MSYDQLLDVFWSNHNPTTFNRQGPDVGTQYRSVIFYHSPEQQAAANASKEKLEKSGRFNRPIVTQIEPASNVLARRRISSALSAETRPVALRGLNGIRFARPFKVRSLASALANGMRTEARLSAVNAKPVRMTTSCLRKRREARSHPKSMRDEISNSLALCL